MRKLFLLLVTILFSFSIFFVYSDQPQKLNMEQVNKIHKIDESSAQALMEILKKQLVETLNEGGQEEAIELCASRAIPKSGRFSATIIRTKC